MIFTDVQNEPASYKDADGFVFYANDKVYRKVAPEFEEKYATLKNSGIYAKAIKTGFLIPFEEVESEGKLYLTCEKIPFISYPYEWSFEQMKSAALFHLQFLRFCMENNCMLKDASPYNIQFLDGKTVFIDILSLVPYTDNTPWIAYKQFCEFFVSPLVLSSYFKGNWNQELLINIEGIPLLKAASMLPLKAWLNSLASFHILAHSKVKAGKVKDEQIKKFPKSKILSIVKHLQVEIGTVKPYEKGSNWSDYLKSLPYSASEIELKKNTVTKWVSEQWFTAVLDVGANHSVFSESISKQAKQVVLIDNDPSVIDAIYKENKNAAILPLCIDITNVSPSIGLNLEERKSFFDRIKPDLTLALAVTHHLFHSRNIPLNKIADLFKTFSSLLIIEFIDASDEMYQKIKNPNNKHPYSKGEFEKSFKKHFTIVNEQEIKSGKRHLYLMKLK